MIKSTEEQVEEITFGPLQKAEKVSFLKAGALKTTVFILHKHNPSYKIREEDLLCNKIKTTESKSWMECGTYFTKKP